MKFFSKIQIFGVALATLVALSLTACGESKGGGENKEQSKEQSKEESKEQSKEQNKEENKKENSQLSAYVKRKCPQCVFTEGYRYERARVGLMRSGDSGMRCYTADYYRRYYKAGTYDSEIEELEALQVRFDERFKIETTVQEYKVRDDYQPEDKWEWRGFEEYVITLLSMPEGVKKVAVSIDRIYRVETADGDYRLEDFTAPQQTRKVYGYFYYSILRLKTNYSILSLETNYSILSLETNYSILSLETNALNDGKSFCIVPYTQSADEAKANTNEQVEPSKEYVEPTNSTQNSVQTAQPSEQDSQSADETKASTNEQSPANEQIKPSFDCAKASTNAEKLVCSDNELANLDNELSKAYTNARNSLDNAGKKQLTSEQKAWLETHNQCADKECVKQSLQKRIELLKSTDTRIYLETKDEFVNLRKSPNGEILTPIYKKDFDKIILKRLGVEDKWLKVLYFPPNVSDEKEALTGYIHNSQIK